MSVADLVAELVPLASVEDSLADLQRQWDLIERGEIATVPTPKLNDGCGRGAHRISGLGLNDER
jgi:hypothetical protein